MRLLNDGSFKGKKDIWDQVSETNEKGNSVERRECEKVCGWREGTSIGKVSVCTKNEKKIVVVKRESCARDVQCER